eukprot:COSAG01_NODE_79894_length_125_cov_52.615385_1_plen_29_part_01
MAVSAVVLPGLMVTVVGATTKPSVLPVLI